MLKTALIESKKKLHHSSRQQKTRHVRMDKIQHRHRETSTLCHRNDWQDDGERVGFGYCHFGVWPFGLRPTNQRLYS